MGEACVGRAGGGAGWGGQEGAWAGTRALCGEGEGGEGKGRADGRKSTYGTYWWVRVGGQGWESVSVCACFCLAS